MTANPDEPDYDYIAYIDDSGETGLKNILAIDANGSSEWFILSLVIVAKADIPNIDGWVAEIVTETKTRLPDLHFADLLPSQKLKAAKLLRDRAFYRSTKITHCLCWQLSV